MILKRRQHPHLHRAAESVKAHPWTTGLSTVGAVGAIVGAFYLVEAHFQTREDAARDARTNAVGRGYVQLRVLLLQKSILDSQIYPLSYRKQNGEKLDRADAGQLDAWINEREDVLKQIDKARESIAALQGVK
jgi:hypothetical protein